MSYADRQDMVDRFDEQELIDLTDRPDPATGATTRAIVDTVLNQALADASADIDGALCGRYQLPLAVVPPVLKRLACDMARYYLYGKGVPEAVEKRYEGATKLLLAIATGKVGLGIPGPEAPASSNTVQFQSAGSVFARERR
jgi:phage gp36-like protein